MNRLLQLSTYGFKNIKEMINIDLANQTIENGIQKVNNVKGIFGFNGAGKTAIISSLYYYKNIVCNFDFLSQYDVKSNLEKLINFEINEFYISLIFEYSDKQVLKHEIKLSKNNPTNNFLISEEKISVSIGRTINDKYLDIITKLNDEIIVNNQYIDKLEYLNIQSLKNNSIVQMVLLNILNRKEQLSSLSKLDLLILSLYFNVDNIDIYLQTSDLHKNYKFNKDELIELIEHIKHENIEVLSNVYFDDDKINKDNFDLFKKETIKLQKFIQYFKPELKRVELIPIENANVYHVRKVFVYEKYNVELEFESSGIKQLVKLFTYLERCARGKIVFIDEIDTNINAVYFEKLISFFKNYGEGQLIFTTHNIESMKALKGQSRSIVVLGVDNKVDTWVGKGNKSPINDYINGDFPHSPMNVEDFDFINIFMGDK